HFIAFYSYISIFINYNSLVACVRHFSTLGSVHGSISFLKCLSIFDFIFIVVFRSSAFYALFIFTFFTFCFVILFCLTFGTTSSFFAGGAGFFSRFVSRRKPQSQSNKVH